MIYGPCITINRTSPYMKDGQCSLYFRNKFQDVIIVYQNGYPVYSRRDNGNIIVKNGVIVDNHSVVPYNLMLLLKY